MDVRKAVGSSRPARPKIVIGWTMPCTIMPSASSISTMAARPNMAREIKATARLRRASGMGIMAGRPASSKGSRPWPELADEHLRSRRAGEPGEGDGLLAPPGPPLDAEAGRAAPDFQLLRHGRRRLHGADQVLGLGPGHVVEQP